MLCALIISSDTNAQPGVYESNLALNTRSLSNSFSKLTSDGVNPALVNAYLAVTETHVNVTCYGAATGSIDISVSDGTAPYSYSWSNGAISEDLSGLVAGTYTVTVTDAVGETLSLEVTITQASAVSVSASQTNVLCNGASTGAVNITPGGGMAPYTYAWTGTVVNPASQNQAGLTAGNYSVRVTDVNGCSSNPLSVNLDTTSISGINK